MALSNEELEKVVAEFESYFNGNIPDPKHEPIRFAYYVRLFKMYKENTLPK